MAPSFSVPDAPSLYEESSHSLIARLKSADPRERESAAAAIFRQGRALAQAAVASWLENASLRECFQMAEADFPKTAVGVAVDPVCFEEIRTATGVPHLADVPADLDAKEFELEFSRGVRIDVLTTRDPDGPGAIAGYLKKSGPGIQQVEIFTRDVERATQI